MSLLFAYTHYPSLGSVPIWSLSGRFVRPRPVVKITVIGPMATWVGPALLDTGSDDTVFPEDVATRIGLDLTNALTGTASGVGMASSPIRYAEVTLRLTDGVEFREWPARVGFTPAPLKRALLGFADCFQFFTATFDGEGERVELTVNTHYPGT